CHRRGVLIDQAGLGLGKLHRLPGSALLAYEQEPEQTDDDEQREESKEQGCEPRNLRRRFLIESTVRVCVHNRINNALAMRLGIEKLDAVALVFKIFF